MLLSYNCEIISSNNEHNKKKYIAISTDTNNEFTVKKKK